MKFWINTVSRDHVLLGKKGGFIQAGHGKASPLKRLSKGDYVIYYSPRTSLKNGESLQRFTAICRIQDDLIYQAETELSFCPYRRGATYFDVTEVEIKPLIPSLSFIKNKRSWGFMFRVGLFAITKADFDLIAKQMKLRSRNRNTTAFTARTRHPHQGMNRVCRIC